MNRFLRLWDMGIALPPESMLFILVGFRIYSQQNLDCLRVWRPNSSTWLSRVSPSSLTTHFFTSAASATVNCMAKMDFRTISNCVELSRTKDQLEGYIEYVKASLVRTQRKCVLYQDVPYTWTIGESCKYMQMAVSAETGSPQAGRSHRLDSRLRQTYKQGRRSNRQKQK
jgi:hypothetical protein